MIINALGEYKVGHGHSAIFGENLYRQLVDKDVDSGGVTRHHRRMLCRPQHLHRKDAEQTVAHCSLFLSSCHPRIVIHLFCNRCFSLRMSLTVMNMLRCTHIQFSSFHYISGESEVFQILFLLFCKNKEIMKHLFTLFLLKARDVTIVEEKSTFLQLAMCAKKR